MRPRTLAGLSGLLLGAVILARPAPGRADGFAVLVHRSNPVQTLSRSELKKVVQGGTKQWPSGAVVQLGVIPGDAPETQFLAALLEMAPRELISRIQEQVFKGEMRRPVTLRSSADCTALVGASPGAICVAASAAGVPPEAHAIVVR